MHDRSCGNQTKESWVTMAARVNRSGEEIIKVVEKKASQVEHILFACYDQALNSSNKCMRTQGLKSEKCNELYSTLLELDSLLEQQRKICQSENR